MLILGKTQAREGTARKSQCIFREGSQYYKSAVWTQSKECSCKNYAEIWKAHQLQSEDKQGVALLWLKSLSCGIDTKVDK